MIFYKSTDKSRQKAVAFYLVLLYDISHTKRRRCNLSAPKTYLPMLNGLMLGDAISSHDGVCCYPAIRHTNQEKYILKVISVPASQVQMDALLLTGAFPSREAALEYYMDISRDMLRETEILKQLSQQEGFIPYLDSQIISTDNLNGYEVYLLSTFKHSAERMFATETLTHKQILRMGLDLCAALTACRRSGYLYVDLKPGNIFYSQEHGFRIGDVGFASLASLAYSSLPEKYRSPYTAPELLDEMAVLNTTVDVYALGLVLYEAYNGGRLPEMEDGTFPAPLYADYAFTDIILKACHPDPAMRWKDPMALAQAIISYMQDNPVSDSPIVPIVESDTPQDMEDFLPEADPDELRREIEELNDSDFSVDIADSQASEVAIPLPISDMLAQADELIAHELPEPPVAPPPIDVPMPERIYFDPEPEEIAEIQTDLEEPAPPVDTPVEEPPSILEKPVPKKDKRSEKTTLPPIHWEFPWKALAIILAIVAILFASFGCYYVYQNYYLQEIDEMILTYQGNTLSVQVVSSVDQQLLTVVCSDSYGNLQRQPLEDGIAIFQNLNPQTHYSVRVEISGWHKLIGDITDSFTTDPQTQITLLTAQIGNTDGSVVISFESKGPDAESWVISYSPIGHDVRPKHITFHSKTVEIMGLEIGTTYAFTLARADGQALAGQTLVHYTGSEIILPQEPNITHWDGSSLTVQWNTPESVADILWEVHCYNANGYSQQITTKDLEVTFTGMDDSVDCIIEIRAKGMPQCSTVTAYANHVTVDTFTASETEDGMLLITWTFTGHVAEEGWMVVYSVNDQPQIQVNATEASVSLPFVPGAAYEIQVDAIGTGIQFGGQYTYTCPDADAFDQWGLVQDDLNGVLCICPDAENWTAEDITEDMYTTKFLPEQSMVLVLTAQTTPEATENTMKVRFVFLDNDGNLISVIVEEISLDEAWSENTCVLRIPQQPEAIGEYLLDIYVNGQYLGQWAFSVEESE